ncbi:hypothetical protein I250019C1_17720 [Faecalibacterium sp. i25-0019-C1]
MLWDEPKIFFLERRYFFSIILSEFLKNRVALQKECGPAALGRRWYRQKFHGGLYCQCPDGAGSGGLYDEFCPDHE